MDRTSWIVVTLCLLGLGGWFYFQPKAPPRVVKAATPAVAADSTPPSATPSASPNPPAEAASTPGTPVPPPDEKKFDIDNDGVQSTFSNIGGGLRRITLPPHKFSGDEPTELNEFGAGAVGALSRGAGDIESAAYDLKSASGQTPVVYERLTPENLLVQKTWTPLDGAGKGFLWKLAVAFKNQGAQKQSGTYYLYTGAAQPLRVSDQIRCGAVWNADSSPKWDGQGVIFDGAPFDGGKKDKLEMSFGELLWGGVRSQYYTTLIATTLPANATPSQVPAGRLWAERRKVDFTQHQAGSKDVFTADAGVSMPDINLDPGASVTHEYEIYIGPRAHSVLSSLDERKDANRHFDDVMFYGWWGFVSRRMLTLLTFIEPLFRFSTANWGLAVVFLTLLVRGLMWPLSIKSTRQMKRMALLSPQMKELQAKYKDDPPRMNAEVMKLYKKFGVNPASGCLPMFIQIPIFFGLYRMLMSAVELRGHGFWWVKDLSMPDTQGHLPAWMPWFLGGMAVNPLPLLMTATMFVQMLLTPKSPDPNMQQQQKIMMIMPFGFLFVCYDFAAALALYWTISNLIGILQSYIMKRLPEPGLVERLPGSDSGGPSGGGSGGGGKKGGGGGKPSFMELFAQRLTEQQKKAAAKPPLPSKGSPRTGGAGGSALKK